MSNPAPKVTLKLPMKTVSKDSSKPKSSKSSSKPKVSKPAQGQGGSAPGSKTKPKPKAKAMRPQARPNSKPKGKPLSKGGGVSVGGMNKRKAGKLGKAPAKQGPLQLNVNMIGTKKKDDVQVDLEQQFVLRMPPGPAMALRHDVESGAMNLKDKLSIELANDHRHGNVRYGGQVFIARLVDLPCVVESMKTTDRKTFYKTADICQMLLCKDSDFDSDEETSPKKPKEKEKKYQWNHGITAPLKNVRKRRFRKTTKKKQYQDQPDIEKEVKRLFRMDNEAIDVKWEVVIEEENDQPGTGDNADHPQQVLAHGDVFNPLNSSAANAGMKPVNVEAGDLGRFLEEDIFGDVSSSDEDDENTEINIMDSGEDDATPVKLQPAEAEDNDVDANDSMMSSVQNEIENDNDNDNDEDSSYTDFGQVPKGDFEIKAETEPPRFTVKTEFESFMSTDPTATNMNEDEIRERMSELSQHMQDLRDRRLQQEMELAMMDSSSLRDRLERELNNMIEEENEKQKEYDDLAAMLNIPT